MKETAANSEVLDCREWKKNGHKDGENKRGGQKITEERAH